MAVDVQVQVRQILDSGGSLSAMMAQRDLGSASLELFVEPSLAVPEPIDLHSAIHPPPSGWGVKVRVALAESLAPDVLLPAISRYLAEHPSRLVLFENALLSATDRRLRQIPHFESASEVFTYQIGAPEPAPNGGLAEMLRLATSFLLLGIETQAESARIPTRLEAHDLRPLASHASAMYLRVFDGEGYARIRF